MSLRLISILLTGAALFTITIPEISAQGRRTVTLSASGGATRNAYLYEEVDVHPSFPGGDHKMINFINSERHYPEKAYDAGIEGRVLCSCIIAADGEISNIEVVRGVEASLDREAVRIIGSMPKWEPGKIDNVPVDTYCLIPVPFRL
ncbi:MAG: energy transducer TonB [Bacteroides sp.]|nr:energy transducer TonB [Bacteroides sp.]